MKRKSNPILIASDHAGFELKQKLIAKKQDILWEDLGCFSLDKTDYPDWANKLCKKINSKNKFGVLICGSGQGMAIKANRYPHIRASLCWSEEIATLARNHNQSNVLCLPGRFLKPAQAIKILDAFLKAKFKKNKNYIRRVKKL